MINRANVAVVGGGIVGLAHAWAAARRGQSVVLFERDGRAQGASVRNFGMIWPIGQPPGDAYRRALRSRDRWLELAAQVGFWHLPCGSLHLAFADDEWAVLQEFAALAPGHGIDCTLLNPTETVNRCPAVRPEGLRGSLWSPTELCIDPPQAVSRIPLWLGETLNVQLRFGATVTAVEMPSVRTSTGETWEVERVLVCSGTDFQTLFPEVFATSGIRRCKLQMMRTVAQPNGWRLGPHVAGGLTLCHYPSFQVCPSLPRLRHRIEEQMPGYRRHGIHVMASQNHLNEIVIGDSHEYDGAVGPFDKPLIDELILDYLRRMIDLKDWTLAARWHGVYAKHSTLPLFTAEPQPGATIFTAPGGVGMTMSFGYAEDWWEGRL